MAIAPRRKASLQGLRGGLVALLLVGGSPASQAALTLDTSRLTGANYDELERLTLTAAPPGAYGWVELNWSMPRLMEIGTKFSTGAARAFNADRDTQFPGWTFADAETELGGTIRIDHYVALDIPGEVFGRGGASIMATYLRAEGDPANLAWVSYFIDNVGGLTEHIDPFPNDDLGEGGGTEGMPFYYRTNEGIGRLDFGDRPSSRVTSIPFFRSVFFETYLVGFDPGAVNDGIAGGKITVYGGFEWGYRVYAQVPEPSALSLVVMAVGLLAVIHNRSLRGRPGAT